MDYFRWRQVDCHINNLYNTVFWMLVQGHGLPHREVEEILARTRSAEKNEMLFKEGVNYNEVPEVFRRGTILRVGIDGAAKERSLVESHADMLKDAFWEGLLEAPVSKKAAKRMLHKELK
jgi:tRNA(His) guanylyltransferase